MLNAIKLSKLTQICVLLSIFICMESCEQEVVKPYNDNSPLTGKPVKVHINLMGAEFENYEVVKEGIRTTYEDLKIREPRQVASEKYIINPSTMVQTSVLSESTIPQKPRMTYIKAGKMFRVIAYKNRNNLSYYTHKDYVVGDVIEPLILEQNVVYTIVAYSYDSNTLPMITSGERENISNEILNYNDDKRNFMSVKIPNYTAKDDINLLNIILKHNISQFTVKLDSYVGDIDKISMAKIYPHHRHGIINLASNKIMYIEDETFENIRFYSGNYAESMPVFINADTKGEKTGMLSMEIVIDGKRESLNMPNLFKISPGTKNQINIEFKKCGAYLGPNPENWREFMCHNLGANYNSDPFTPSPNLHGAKYQWGNKTPIISQTEDQDPINDINVIGWRPLKPSQNNAWSDVEKTENDPCPKSYRLISKEEWDRIAYYNDIKTIGNWEENVTNYGSGIMIGDKLFLPNEGFRRHKDARIMKRGVNGMYWTSSRADEYKYIASFEYGNYNASKVYEESLLSVRCIKE